MCLIAAQPDETNEQTNRKGSEMVERPNLDMYILSCVTELRNRILKKDKELPCFFNLLRYFWAVAWLSLS